jgi:hypothetical protein
MNKWSMTVTNYTGTLLGELRGASARRFSFPLNQMATGTCRVRLDHPMALTLLQGDCLVQLWQDTGTGKQLRINYEVAAVEEVAGGGEARSLVVTFVDAAYWRLSHRLIGKSAAGQSFAGLDKSTMAQLLLSSINSESHTGVREGSIGVSSNATVGPWRYKPFTEALLELSSTLDGFDFEFTHYFPTTDGSGFFFAMMTAEGVIGTTRTNTVFEYGTGRRNIKTYRRQVSRDGLMTRGFTLPPGFPETSEAVVSAESTASIAARGLHEAVVATDLVVAASREQLVREHLKVRKAARQVISFTPTGYNNEFNVDYEVGDVVTARARTPQGDRFNAAFRVFGVEVELDDTGQGSYEMTLVAND